MFNWQLTQNCNDDPFLHTTYLPTYTENGETVPPAMRCLPAYEPPFTSILYSAQIVTVTIIVTRKRNHESQVEKVVKRHRKVALNLFENVSVHPHDINFEPLQGNVNL